MLNFVCRKKGGLKFALFYTFFTNNLSQKGYCAPSVSAAMVTTDTRAVQVAPLVPILDFAEEEAEQLRRDC